MSTLPAELSRLYLARERDTPSLHDAAPGLMTPDGHTRTMVLALARPADWALLSPLWRGVQTDLDLPAPAIAVSGVDAYQLWFSLAEPVPAAQASAFLEALRLRYLRAVSPERLSLLPSVDAASPGHVLHALLVPALQPATGRWSAFIAPDLAAIFSEEPWLDLPPNPDAQANVLSRLESIKPAVFHAALAQLGPGVRPADSPVAGETAGHPTNMDLNAASIRSKGLDPKEFLLGVMNDKTIELHLRIEAAKALLPYFEGRGGSM